MKQPLIATVLYAAAICLPGCAVQGRPFEKALAPPNHAVIYVYRPYHYGSSLLKPPVDCGGESAVIEPGGYHAFVVPAGRVVCSVSVQTTDEVEIDAEPRAYYIREEFGWGDPSLGHPHLNPMDADTAHDEIATCCVEQP
jgi:hypothetical protein